MRKSWFFGIVFLVCIIPFVALGANTVNIEGNVITISAIDSDWEWDNATNGFPDHPSGIRIQSIIFYPAATDDKCVIKNGSATGPEFFPVLTADTYDQRGWRYDGVRLKPVLDFSAGTYTAGSFVVIILYDR